MAWSWLLFLAWCGLRNVKVTSLAHRRQAKPTAINDDNNEQQPPHHDDCCYRKSNVEETAAASSSSNYIQEFDRLMQWVLGFLHTHVVVGLAFVHQRGSAGLLLARYCMTITSESIMTCLATSHSVRWLWIFRDTGDSGGKKARVDKTPMASWRIHLTSTSSRGDLHVTMRATVPFLP